MSQEADNKNIMRRYVDALQAADTAAVASFFAEDATWTLLAGDLRMSGTWRGRDRIMDGFLATAMTNGQPGSVELETTAAIAEQDRVVLHWTGRARTRDGQPYENGCIAIFTVRDGKIQGVREYMDTLYLSRALSREAAAVTEGV